MKYCIIKIFYIKKKRKIITNIIRLQKKMNLNKNILVKLENTGVKIDNKWLVKGVSLEVKKSIKHQTFLYYYYKIYINLALRLSVLRKIRKIYR